MLVELDELKEYLQIETTSFDIKLTQILKGIDSRVKKHCGRSFERDTQTEIIQFDYGTGFLNNTPISSITKIEDFEGNSYDYILIDPNTGEIELYFLTNRRYKVTYEGGMLVEDIPEDLKLAVKKWCEFEYNNQTGLTNFSMDSVSYKTEITKSGIPVSVEKILDAYKNVRM